MIVGIPDHGPHSEEVYFHGGTKCLLESFSELVIVGFLVEVVCECDLFVVVPWQ